MKHLITMEQYVIENCDPNSKEYKHAKLLQSKPTLGQFVPCDDEGNVLEEPKGIKCCAGIINDCGCHGELIYDDEQVFKYKQALEKVIFDGWSVSDENMLETILSNGDNKISYNVFTEELYFNDTKINTLSDITKFKLKLK